MVSKAIANNLLTTILANKIFNFPLKSLGHKRYVRNAGIGPASYAWEAHVLPLNQFRLSYILPKIRIFATRTSW